MNNIGDRIKSARVKSGLTQKELAKKCNLAEITIRQYENGKRQPRIETSQTIAAVLKIPFNYIDPRLPEERDLYLEEFYNDSAKKKEIDSHVKLNEIYNQLNESGKNKLINYADDLTKIPDYQKDPTAPDPE